MDREKLLQHLEKRYDSKRDMISRIPLGVQPDAIWQELQKRRRAGGTEISLTNHRGRPYWYVTTKKMAAASEKIVDTLFQNETEFDPYTDTLTVTTLEEVFYTSYVEGSRISIQEAMDFLTSESPPRDMEEQLIANNRMAGSYAGSNLYRPIDAAFLQDLSFLLTDGLDHGGSQYRSDDFSDYVSVYSNYHSLPPAHEIPSKVDEITGFLADGSVHPLVKAAVAQAWTILVRPFSEGNERLGRMLSNTILLRAGYTFFSEISLSAMIARKSYGYYQAIENILQEEHDGDLTYFLEYFMDLLARSIDEWTLRKRKREEENRLAEVELAHTPLSRPDPSVPYAETVQPEMYTGLSAEWTKYEESGQIETMPPAEELNPDESLSPIEYLQKNAEHPDRIIGRLSIFILKQIFTGNTQCCVSQAAAECQLKPNQLSTSIRFLKDRGILIFDKKTNDTTFYRIEAGEISESEQIEWNLKTAEEQGVGRCILDMIRTLLESPVSMKDRRLGTMLSLFISKGRITLDDYIECGSETRWKTDMDLAWQLGLVEKSSPTECTILRELKTGPPVLSKKQKKVMTEMYENFGDSTFSVDMVIAVLDYTDSHASSLLHRFTLLKILDCRKEDVNKYQFLVTPEEYPQLFEKAA